MIELVELDNGDLEVKVINRKQLLNLIKQYEDPITTLFDLLVSSAYIGNGYEVMQSNQPTIAFGAVYEDNELVHYTDKWVGPENFLTELKKYNFVTFFKFS